MEAFCPHLLYHPDSISSMDAKEYPKDFRCLRPGLDLMQTVMLLLCPKATLQTGRPLLGQKGAHRFHLVFMLSGPSLAHEAGNDVALAAKRRAC